MNIALARSEPISGVVRAQVAPADRALGRTVIQGLIALRERLMKSYGEYVLVVREMSAGDTPLGTQYSLGIINVGEPLILDLTAKTVTLRTRYYASLVDAPEGEPDFGASLSRDIVFRSPDLLKGLLRSLPGLETTGFPDETEDGRRSRCTILVGDAEVLRWVRTAPVRGAALHTLEDILFDRLACSA